MFIKALCEKLNATKVSYALVGGYAVALHGAVRGTVDVDLVLSLNAQNMNRAESALLEMGLVSRLPLKSEEVFQFREEYIQKRNLIAWNFYSPTDPTQMVDLILTENLDALEIVTKQIGKLSIPVLAIDDLIKMKKRAGRPQDLADISALKRIKA